MAIKHVFGWLARKSLLYFAIVAAILASTFLLPWIETEWTGPGVRLDNAIRLEEARSQLETDRADAQRRLTIAAGAARTMSLSELKQAADAAGRAKAALVARRRSAFDQNLSLARFDTDALLRDRRVELEIQLREAEIRGLTAAQRQLENRATLAGLATRLPTLIAAAEQSRVTVGAARDACSRASQELAAFERRWLVRLTLQHYEMAQHGALKSRKADRCRAADLREAAYRQQKMAADAARAQQAAAEELDREARGWADSRIASVTGDLDQKIRAERTGARGSWRAKADLWAKQVHLGDVLRNAAIALAFIIATPFIIRLFCYFVIAPAAMRRPAIRLRVPGGAGVAIPVVDRSTPSVGVRLRAGEQLLVRQDYLQTSSQAASKETQWLFDWRFPITSLATGLIFLTRIRGEDELTTVSAIRNPFAEVTLLELPEGSSCVLQPRALAAVAHPISLPLRIDSRWRILSLNAWLTMQLRYLVFHGPARLVIKGGRGIRVERAEEGRIFGHRQLVGFSADLAYSVTRTETFWPYFLGREQLLKDRVGAGDGVLIIEEAPMAGGRPGDVRQGMEGMVDAGMKLFGM